LRRGHAGALQQVGPPAWRGRGGVNRQGEQFVFPEITFKRPADGVLLEFGERGGGRGLRQIVNEIFLEAEPGPGMVNDDEVELPRERVNRQVAEFVAPWRRAAAGRGCDPRRCR
jgi:hypothetical protein